MDAAAVRSRVEFYSTRDPRMISDYSSQEAPNVIKCHCNEQPSERIIIIINSRIVLRTLIRGEDQIDISLIFYVTTTNHHYLV